MAYASRDTAPKKPHEKLPAQYRYGSKPEFLAFGNRCLTAINGLIDKQNEATKSIYYGGKMASTAMSGTFLDMVLGGSGESSFAFARAKTDESYGHAKTRENYQKKIDIIKYAMTSAGQSDFEIKEREMQSALLALDDPTAVLFKR